MVFRRQHIAARALLCAAMLGACAPQAAPVQSPEAKARASASVAPSTGDLGPVPVTAADPSRGNPLAPVTIVEFADFQCGYCQRAAVTMMALQKEYGPDRVRIVWKNFPLSFHPSARPAAAAAMAIFERAGADGFWKFHDTIFHAPRELGPDLFEEALGATGVALDDVKSAVHEGSGFRKIEADEALAHTVGVSGTPSFFVNGVRVHGARPIDQFRPVVDAQLKLAQGLIASGATSDRVYAELSRRNYVAPEAEADEPEDKTVYKVPVGASAVRGAATALVTIVELADFECPYCVRAEEPLQKIAARYGDKVRFVWKNVPLPFHKHAEPAAELAVEARAQKGDAGFWKAHDLLLAANGHLEEADLSSIAKTLGLDVARARKRVADHAYAAVIAADLELAEDLDVSGTPTFFINGRKVIGAQSADAFATLIDAEIANAQALLKTNPSAAVYDLVQANGKLPGFEAVAVPAPTAANPSRGPAGAKVTVEIWSDFECPFCKRVEPTLAELSAAYPGQLRVVWHNNPIASHVHAMPAAEAAMEAFAQKGDAGFWKMHDLILENQGGSGQERAALESYAATVGLDLARFRAALDGGIHRAAITADAKIGTAAGLDATPGFVINGYRLVGALPLGNFRRIVRHVLAN